MIPRDCPFSAGWRAEVAALVLAHGLADVLDAVSAFAELWARCPVGERTLFDRLEAKQVAAPAHRRIRRKQRSRREQLRAADMLRVAS